MPFTQVVAFFSVALGCVEGVGVTVGVRVCWVNFTLIVGEEKVKPEALSRSQPSLSDTTVVATVLTPDAFCTETVAEIGALVKL